MRTETKPPPDLLSRRGLLGPAWRERTARTLPEHVSARIAQGQNPAVLAYRRYLTLDSSGEVGAVAARADFPQIAAAVELHCNAGLTEKLKCMVLAEISTTEMAERLLLDAAAIETWESLFFDVRPSLQARDWVLLNVIEPPFKAGDVTTAARLQLAFTGGPVVGRSLLDGDCELPLDDAERLLGKKLRMDLKLREAYEIPVLDAQHALGVMRLANDIRRLELAEKKLAQNALAAARRHELAVQRLELSAKRMDQAEAARREAQLRREAQRRVRQQAKNGDSPLQRQAAADFAEFRANLKRRALAERIARSPLAQLTWAQSIARPVEPVSPPVCRAQVSVFTSPTQEAEIMADEATHEDFFGEAADLAMAGATAAHDVEISFLEA